ncbi:hypothetical protein [Streptomyces spiramyceticus]|uniref:hypothetical protein n=1 Tax=Streptomyces spiramyceticus TaxID=299717 RepID=UPI003B75B5E6
MRLMRRMRRWYGEGPLQFLLLVITFALAAHAGVRLLEGDTLAIAAWFVGAALVHDVVLLPLYASVDLAVRRSLGAEPHLINFVRVPALLSGLLLLVWFPLITRQAERYRPAAGLSADPFLGHWLLITAALFAVSAVWLFGRALRSRRRAGRSAGR